MSRNRCFPGAGLETTNIRWGIESVLQNHGAVAPEGLRQLIVDLEDYFINIIHNSTGSSLTKEEWGQFEVGASLANVQFDSEE